MNDNNAQHDENIITVLSEGKMYKLCEIKISTAFINAGELLALICSHPNVQRDLPGIVASYMCIKKNKDYTYKHTDSVSAKATVYLCQKKSDDSVTVASNEWTGSIRVLDAVDETEVCTVNVNEECTNASELLLLIQTKTGNFDYVGLNTKHRRMLNSSESVRVHETVWVCKKEKEKEPIVDDFTSHPVECEGKNEYLHDTIDDLTTSRVQVTLLFHPNTRSIEKVYPGVGPVKGGLMKYVYKKQTSKETVTQFKLDEGKYATIKVIDSNKKVMHVVILKVSKNGCRAKLALEMVCLYKQLNRDNWKFKDVTIDWINPRDTIEMVQRGNKRFL